MCDGAKIKALHDLLSTNLLPQNHTYHIEHDALKKDGTPVLFCCLLNMPKLHRFKTGIAFHKSPGTVIAFDFQQEMLRRYFGDGVEYVSLSFEKFKARFFSD